MAETEEEQHGQSSHNYSRERIGSRAKHKYLN